MKFPALFRGKSGTPERSDRRIGVTTMAVAGALFLAVFDNLPLWKAIAQIAPPTSLHNLGIFAIFAIVVFALFVILLALFGFRYVFKPTLAVLLITAATVSYFMNAFGIVIDRAMIQNVFETDVREATELLSLGLAWHVLLFGVAPAWLVFRIPVHYGTFWREAGRRGLLLGVCLLVIGGAVFAGYKDLSLIIRQNRHLRLLVNPTYPVYAFVTYVKQLSGHQSVVIHPIAKSAVQSPSWRERSKPRLVVFVLGETARAANFSLNGYGRETNPLLSRAGVVNFTDVTSCATATADSVPCLFSGMQRENFSNSQAKQSENLLDLLSKSGVRVLWRDNNSGSKGVANRVPMEDMQHLKVNDLCHDDECFDEILLHNLQAAVDRAPGDLFLILHQKGSHGPLYYKRVPDAFRRFTPDCRQDEVQKCSREEIVNAYDNTILYTDYFLNRTLDFLKGNSGRYETALLYMSDHGESLGENGIYLHGAPYMFAPAEQTHIPFVAWFSPELVADTGIDLPALHGQAAEPASHDNLFHTVLGLFDVQTEIYRPDLDLLSTVRKPAR